MAAVYTRTGDDGGTGLFGGTRVAKQSLRVEAYGAVDEANTVIGMAKAKYYLLTCEPLDGVEAERLGLVSLVVEDDELQEKSMEVARKMKAGSASAIRFTKYSLNNWLRLAGPTFDTSLALEFLGFTGPDVREGIASLREKRQPEFKDEPQI